MNERITNYGHTTPKTMWFNSHENLELLIRYLIEDDSIGSADFTLENVLPVLEKPWHWEWEFEKAQEKYQVSS